MDTGERFETEIAIRTPEQQAEECRRAYQNEPIPRGHWQTWIYVALATLVAGFCFGVAAGVAVSNNDNLDPTGHEGQVYVVDSGRWVDADDHAAHMEHG